MRTLFILLGFSSVFALSNLDVRGCMTKAVSAQGLCDNEFQKCFQDSACSNEFDDLFDVCVIAENDETYDSSCPQEGMRRAQGQKVKDLMGCLGSNCGLLGNQTEPSKEFTQRYEQMNKARQNVKLETLRDCVTNSLVDASKCWLLTKDCDQECIEGLDVIKNCSTQIEGGQIKEGKQCLRQLSFEQELGAQIRDCLVEQCFNEKREDL